MANKTSIVRVGYPSPLFYQEWLLVQQMSFRVLLPRSFSSELTCLSVFVKLSSCT